jgi:hypothetical protein
MGAKWMREDRSGEWDMPQVDQRSRPTVSSRVSVAMTRKPSLAMDTAIGEHECKLQGVLLCNLQNGMEAKSGIVSAGSMWAHGI